MTMLHFLAQIMAEKYPDMLGFMEETVHVEKAAKGMCWGRLVVGGWEGEQVCYSVALTFHPLVCLLFVYMEF